MGKAKIRGQETRGRAIEEILVFEVVWVKAVETKWNKGFHFIWNEKYLGVKLRWAACPGWPGIFLILRLRVQNAGNPLALVQLRWLLILSEINPGERNIEGEAKGDVQGFQLGIMAMVVSPIKREK